MEEKSSRNCGWLRNVELSIKDKLLVNTLIKVYVVSQLG